MNRAALFASVALLGGGLWLWSRRSVASVDAFDGFAPDLGALLNPQAGTMRLSSNGLDALKRVEGFSATPYKDAGDFSIGYGHFGLDDLVYPGEAIPSVTEPIAAGFLAVDVAEAESAVNRAVRVALSQSQFDALVSFAYNVGETKFLGSTLLKRLNAGDYAAVPGELRKWRLSNGEVNQSLVRRRELEASIFSGVYA